ncbi:MAG: DNA-directed RNA polymerase subunit omega [Candidatus Omnitrophica bacterium]|nr:DNA-directed RNA polymerase subunit omega [Candidatus Omnitrophota bacterium]
MAYVATEELLKHGESVFKMVITASMRTLELDTRGENLVHAGPHAKHTTVALQEMMEGKVTYEVLVDKDKKKGTK